MVTGSARVIRGNALALPLALDSVDLICTSPPYFGLRSYTDNGAHYAGQIGSEPTPAEFVDALIAATREMVRVLKPTGSIFVNLGDKYSGAQAQNFGGTSRAGASAKVWQQTNPKNTGIPNKSLMGIPWRYALRCIDDLGLILRAEIVLDKKNGLPESVSDRVRRSHEQVFHFVKQPRYFSAVDEIRSAANSPGRAVSAAPRGPALGPEVATTVLADDGPAVARGWCQLGSLKQPIGAAVARDAEGLQVLHPVGFSFRLEAAEGNYVVDLKPRSRSASDATPAIALHDALTQLGPPFAPPDMVAASPVGVAVAPVVVGDALRGAEVLGLECVLIPPKGLAARITLDLNPGCATLLVWDAFATHTDSLPQISSPLGSLPGSVWPYVSQPFRAPAHLGVDHFAAFAMELPRRIIQGWSPAGVCTVCGEGRRPIVAKSLDIRGPNNRRAGKGWIDLAEPDGNARGMNGDAPAGSTRATITGYACGCPEPTAPTRPSTILDPFGGTGTTALVAKALGRIGISVDMSADYCRLAGWRCTDPGQMAAALQVERPEPVSPDQLDLFSEVPV